MPPRKPSANIQLKTRMKEPLRATLAKKAKDRGVSLNAEIVDRLERSLAAEEAEIKKFGNLGIYNYMKLLAATLAFVEEKTGGEWLKDAKTTDQGTMAIYGVMGAFHKMTPARLHKERLNIRKSIGLQAAAGTLRFGGFSFDQLEQWFGLDTGDQEAGARLLGGEQPQREGEQS